MLKLTIVQTRTLDFGDLVYFEIFRLVFPYHFRAKTATLLTVLTVPRLGRLAATTNFCNSEKLLYFTKTFKQ